MLHTAAKAGMMDFSRHPVLVAFAFCCIAYAVVRKIASTIEAWKFRKQHGCRPAARFHQLDPVFGIDVYRTLKKYANNRTGLEANARRCLTEARTMTMTVMGQSFVTTCEPENVKAVLTTNFKDFCIGPRINAFGRLLGRGIFTTDGAEWEHSRVGKQPVS